jgi:DNA repair ATPase RecN
MPEGHRPDFEEMKEAARRMSPKEQAQSAEREAAALEPLKNAQSWDSLYQVLRAARELVAEDYRVYPAEEQIRSIDELRNLVKDLASQGEKLDYDGFLLKRASQGITRTAGLRGKVLEWLKREYPPGGRNTNV